MTQERQTGFAARIFSANDGLQLYARDYGNKLTTKDALPVVCLPGLSRNSRDFHRLAIHLSTGESPRRVVALDYRGRGHSAWGEDKSRYQLPVEAEDVLTACAALDISEAIFIGTSRGGLILHLLSAMRPAVLRGVVLNDIGPVIETAGLIGIRQYLEGQEPQPSWDAAVDQLKQIHGATFPALAEPDWREMAEAMFREKDGAIWPDFDPALVEQLKQIEPGKPLPDLWTLFEGLKAIPLMTIRGENSAILSGDTVTEMARRHPGMKLVTVPEQGHVPLLHHETPRAQITEFVDGIV